MPMQQTQGVQIHGRSADDFATLTVAGAQTRLDVQASGAVQLVDAAGSTINPSSEESVLLLRRIVKLLESSAVVDIANRQKVTLDASTAGFMSAPGVGVSLLGNPVATAAPGVSATAYPLYIWEMPVDQRWRVTEESHVSYQIGIRNQLAFT
jgi:hypothetical protein